MKKNSSLGAKVATAATTVALSAFALAGVASADTAATVNVQIHGGWGAGSGEQHAPGVFGTVSAVSGTTITVSSKGFGKNATATTYTVNAANAAVTKNGASSSVSSIAVGDSVMVQGTVSGNSVTATKIDDGMMGGMGAMDHQGVFGTVASISGSTLTVTSRAMGGHDNDTDSDNGSATTYTVNAASATIMKNGATSSLSAIAVGDTVMVQGTVSGSAVTATKINDGVVPGAGGMGGKGTGPSITGNGEPVVGGTISAISGNSVTITNKSNVTYTIDAASATIEKGNATSSISSLAVGDNVVVQGTVNGSSVTASSIIDSGAAQGSSGNAGGPKGFFGGFLGGIGSFFHNLFGFF